MNRAGSSTHCSDRSVPAGRTGWQGRRAAPCTNAGGPKHVHVVNVEPSRVDIPEWAEFDVGDACALPDHIARRRYDLVFSNSVIEHVGGHERRERFADTVHQLSDAHWVQTPYRYFPTEPHWMAPAAHYLPVAARAQVVRRWRLSFRPGMPRGNSGAGDAIG